MNNDYKQRLQEKKQHYEMLFDKYLDANDLKNMEITLKIIEQTTALIDAIESFRGGAVGCERYIPVTTYHNNKI